MKIIGGFFKLLATVIMLVFILGFPLALMGRGIARNALSSDGLVQQLTEDLLDVEVFASIAEEMVSDIGQQIEAASPEEDYFFGTLTNLDHDEWLQVVELLAPVDLMQDTTEKFLDGFYDWLNGPQPYPTIEIELSEWKENMQTATIPVMEIVLDALPNCTPAEIQSFASNDEIPFCKPPEPLYSNLLVTISTDISERLDEMPDVYRIGEDEFPEGSGAREALLRGKQTLLTLRTILSSIWLLLVAFYLIAIPMGARSSPGIFFWTGIPLFLAGGFTLLWALAILATGGGVASFLSSDLLAELPGALLTPLKAAISGIITLIARPLLLQSGVMMVLGAFATIIALIWRGISKSKIEPEIEPIMEEENPEDYAAHLDITKPMPTEEGPSASDDDSSPSGMYG